MQYARLAFSHVSRESYGTFFCLVQKCMVQRLVSRLERYEIHNRLRSSYGPSKNYSHVHSGFSPCYVPQIQFSGRSRDRKCNLKFSHLHFVLCIYLPQFTYLTPISQLTHNLKYFVRITAHVSILVNAPLSSFFLLTPGR